MECLRCRSSWCPLRTAYSRPDTTPVGRLGSVFSPHHAGADQGSAEGDGGPLEGSAATSCGMKIRRTKPVQPVAEPMAGAIGILGGRNPHAIDEIETLLDETADQAGGGGGIIPIVAVDEHVDVGFNIGKHSPHHISLALACFSSNQRACLLRDFESVVAGIVVVDKDCR